MAADDDALSATVRGAGHLLGIVPGPPGQRIVLWNFHGVLQWVQEIRARDGTWGPSGEIAGTREQMMACLAIIAATTPDPEEPLESPEPGDLAPLPPTMPPPKRRS